MADSTVSDLNKMKVVELRKELKSRGLPSTGDKSELVTRLQAAMSQDQEDHGDINLDSDEIDSDGVLEDEDDKSQTDILDDHAVDTLNEELGLSEHVKPEAEESKPPRTLKRKITTDSLKTKPDDKEDKEPITKKIVLNRAISITPAKTLEEDTPENKPTDASAESNKVKITADVDVKTKLELRAKRFGLPVKMSDNERKEARSKRFGQNTGNTGKNAISTAPIGSVSENIDKLKQRAERFGLSVSKIMTDIENKEKLERRKAKFGTA